MSQALNIHYICIYDNSSKPALVYPFYSKSNWGSGWSTNLPQLYASQVNSYLYTHVFDSISTRSILVVLFCWFFSWGIGCSKDSHKCYIYAHLSTNIRLFIDLSMYSFNKHLLSTPLQPGIVLAFHIKWGAREGRSRGGAWAGAAGRSSGSLGPGRCGRARPALGPRPAPPPLSGAARSWCASPPRPFLARSRIGCPGARFARCRRLRVQGRWAGLEGGADYGASKLRGIWISPLGSWRSQVAITPASTSETETKTVKKTSSPFLVLAGNYITVIKDWFLARISGRRFFTQFLGTYLKDLLSFRESFWCCQDE